MNKVLASFDDDEISALKREAQDIPRNKRRSFLQSVADRIANGDDFDLAVEAARRTIGR